MQQDFRDFVDSVREASNLIGIMREDVPELVQSGGVYRGAKDWPSLIAWDNGTWKDFGGDRGGDVITWLMEIRGFGFREAVRYLAELHGIDEPNVDPGDIEIMNESRELQRVLSAAAALFHSALPTRIRKFLRTTYGFTDETIDKLQIGWAYGALWEDLHKKGFDDDQCLASGLFIKWKKSDRIIEFFEDRVVFPYWRTMRVRYMIGRRIDGITPEDKHQLAKYKKLLTRSSKHPYVSEHIENNIFYNEDAIRGAKTLYITEGVTDCIAGMQAGVSIVSPVTVRFREADLPKLKELTENVERIIVCNDSEDAKAGATMGAGLKGALSTMEALHEAKRDVRVIRLPRPEEVSKIDLCEFLQAQGEAGKAELELLTRVAMRYPEFLLSRIPKDTPAADLPLLLAPVVDTLIGLPALQLSSYVSSIAKRLKLGKNDIKSMVRDRAKELRQEAKAAAGKDDDADTRERILGEVEAGPSYYYVRTREGDVEVVSSFRIEPKQRVSVDGFELMSGDLHCDTGKVVPDVTFPAHVWTSKRAFAGFVNKVSPDLQWTGNDNQTQGLLRQIAAVDVPRRDGSSVLGWHQPGANDTPKWIGPDSIITAGGILEDDELVYVQTANPVGTRLDYTERSDADVLAVAKAVLPRLPALNAPETMFPVIGWFFAAPFRQPIHKLIGHFPSLWVYGTQGGGKTSLVQLLWRMHGISGGAEPFSAQETEFTMLRLYSGASGIPIWQDEYKPSDMRKAAVARLMRFQRRLYAGETESRGRPDLSLTSFVLQAPSVISGEAAPEEPAIRERALLASPRKTHLELHPEAKHSFGEVRMQDLGALAVPYIRWALSRDVRGDLELARQLTHSALQCVHGSDKLPVRVLDNLTVMMFGLLAWEGFAEHLGVEVPDDIEKGLEGCLQELCADYLDGDNSGKDAFDAFLEALSIYAQEGELRDGVHYTIIDDELALHLPSAYAVYQRERAKQRLEDETNGIRALRRVVREKRDRGGGYIRASSAVVPLGAARARCVRIDLKAIPKTLDVDTFPCDLHRTWGGGGQRDGDGKVIEPGGSEGGSQQALEGVLDDGPGGGSDDDE